MAKINIPFYNSNYSIEESALDSAKAKLKSHLQTTMAGSGATINFDGTAYNVDSTKLSNATSEFTTYLGTIAGNGEKVKIGNTEYSVDSTKLSGAISSLETVLEGLNSDEGEVIEPITWDGNTEGLLYIEHTGMYKVSDRVFSNEQIQEWAYTLYNSAIDGYYETKYVSDCWDMVVNNGGVTDDFTLIDGVAIVRKPGVYLGGQLTFPEVGTYFIKTERNGLSYVASFPASNFT